MLSMFGFKKIGIRFSVLFLFAALLWQGNGFFVVADEEPLTPRDIVEELNRRPFNNDDEKFRPKIQFAFLSKTINTDASMHLMRNGKFDEAIERILDNTSKTAALRDTKVVAKFQAHEYYIGTCYLMLGKLDKALKNYNSALSNIEEIFGKDSLEAASIHNNIACAHYNKKDYREAADNYLEAYRIYLILNERMDNYKGTLRSLIAAYKESGNTESFDRWVEKNIGKAATLKIAERKKEQAATKKELTVLTKALIKNRKTSENYPSNSRRGKNFDLTIAKQYAQIGDVFSKLGEHNMAYSFFLMSYQIAEPVVGAKSLKDTYKKIKMSYEKCDYSDSFEESVKEDGIRGLYEPLFLGESIESFIEEIEQELILGEKSQLLERIFDP
ncbi:MAG: tetratricopeptide repeat protein [Planctomycetaceae bacterium]|jgi:tetratricopeptide (TPR) repeat protein|nr:tetratricopeptide repeat protein [Planctomycetaceae bacterium]